MPEKIHLQGLPGVAFKGVTRALRCRLGTQQRMQASTIPPLIGTDSPCVVLITMERDLGSPR